MGATVEDTVGRTVARGGGLSGRWGRGKGQSKGGVYSRGFRRENSREGGRGRGYSRGHGRENSREGGGACGTPNTSRRADAEKTRCGGPSATCPK